MLVSCYRIVGRRITRPNLIIRPANYYRFECLAARHLHSSKLVPPNQTVFSGIQPTGIPHIGNYLGALQQWVTLQNTATLSTNLFFSIVDLHAITIPQQSHLLKKWKRETLAILLAVGLDPDRCVLFYQSSVPAHAELMWILSCTASMGYLSRMTQWKSKLQLGPDAMPLTASSKSRLKLGLFSYPVLQAADILVHRATHVPVGEDQSQHLEFARECATNFNHTYGPHLKAPMTITSSAKRVMSLQAPHLKMSKSHQDPRSRILLTDNPDQVSRKIMAARTDSSNSVSYDPIVRPGVANLLQLLSDFSSASIGPEELGRTHAGLTLGELKKLVSWTISNVLEGIRPRYDRIITEDEGRYLDRIEARGAERARESAGATMELVREAVGL